MISSINKPRMPNNIFLPILLNKRIINGNAMMIRMLVINPNANARRLSVNKASKTKFEIFSIFLLNKTDLFGKIKDKPPSQKRKLKWQARHIKLSEYFLEPGC